METTDVTHSLWKWTDQDVDEAVWQLGWQKPYLVPGKRPSFFPLPILALWCYLIEAPVSGSWLGEGSSLAERECSAVVLTMM